MSRSKTLTRKKSLKKTLKKLHHNSRTRGKTIDDLKELNLGTSEEPKLIFVSAFLSSIKAEIDKLIEAGFIREAK